MNAFLSPFKYILEGNYALTYLDIEKIFKIKSYKLDEDLRNDPQIMGFLYRINKIEKYYYEDYPIPHHDFAINVRDLLSNVFLQLEVLFVFILSGYYSKDNFGLFQRLTDFFTFLTEYIEDIIIGVLENVEIFPDGIVEGDWDYYVELEVEETSIKIRNGNLMLNGSIMGNNFILNIAKIIEDETFNDYDFPYYLMEFYERDEADVILRKIKKS